MNNRTFSPSLRLSATLLLVGQLLYIIVTQFHADGPANNHPVVFAEYARSGIWKAVHLGQRMGYGESEVLNSEGRLLARASGTFIVLPAPRGLLIVDVQILQRSGHLSESPLELHQLHEVARHSKLPAHVGRRARELVLGDAHRRVVVLGDRGVYRVR